MIHNYVYSIKYLLNNKLKNDLFDSVIGHNCLYNCFQTEINKIAMDVAHIIEAYLSVQSLVYTFMERARVCYLLRAK